VRRSLICAMVCSLWSVSASAAPVLLGGGTFAASGSAAIFNPEAELPTEVPLYLKYFDVPGEPCGACAFTIGLNETGTWDVFDLEADFLSVLTNASDDTLSLITLAGGGGNKESIWFPGANRTQFDVSFVRFIVTENVFSERVVPNGIGYTASLTAQWELHGESAPAVPEPTVLALLGVAALWRRYVA
jgi:hypothetical protein